MSAIFVVSNKKGDKGRQQVVSQSNSANQISDLKLLSQLVSKIIDPKLPKTVRNRLINQLSSSSKIDGSISTKIETPTNHFEELKELREEIEILKAQKNYQVFSIFGNISGDLTILTSEYHFKTIILRLYTNKVFFFRFRKRRQDCIGCYNWNFFLFFVGHCTLVQI